MLPFARSRLLRDDGCVHLFGPVDECRAIVATQAPEDVTADPGDDSLKGAWWESQAAANEARAANPGARVWVWSCEAWWMAEKLARETSVH